MKVFNSLVLVSALVLAGCASGPRYTEVKDSIKPVAEGQGRVYFYRSSSMVGAALQPDIKMNGTVVGTSKPGGFFYADSPAGNVVVTTATEVEKQLTFTLEPKETKYVKTSPSFGIMVGRIAPELVSESEAMKEIPELHYQVEAKK